MVTVSFLIWRRLQWRWERYGKIQACFCQHTDVHYTSILYRDYWGIKHIAYRLDSSVKYEVSFGCQNKIIYCWDQQIN